MSLAVAVSVARSQLTGMNHASEIVATFRRTPLPTSRSHHVASLGRDGASRPSNADPGSLVPRAMPVPSVDQTMNPLAPPRSSVSVSSVRSVRDVVS